MGIAVGGTKIDDGHEVAIGGLKIAGMAIGATKVFELSNGGPGPVGWTFTVSDFIPGYQAHEGAQTKNSGSLSGANAYSAWRPTTYSGGEFIQADFGSELFLKKVYIKHAYNNPDYEIATSIDGTTWQNQTPNLSPTSLQTYVFNTPARYVRLKNSGGKVMQITQFYFD